MKIVTMTPAGFRAATPEEVAEYWKQQAELEHVRVMIDAWTQESDPEAKREILRRLCAR